MALIVTTAQSLELILLLFLAQLIEMCTESTHHDTFLRVLILSFFFPTLCLATLTLSPDRTRIGH